MWVRRIVSTSPRLRPPSASCSRRTGSVLVGPGSISATRLAPSRTPVATTCGEPWNRRSRNRMPGAMIVIARPLVWSPKCPSCLRHILPSGLWRGGETVEDRIGHSPIGRLAEGERMRLLSHVLCTTGLAGAALSAEMPARAASPRGTEEIEVGGKWETEKAPNGRERQVYKGGKWVTLSYGRPLKRGRELFG